LKSINLSKIAILIIIFSLLLSGCQISDSKGKVPPVASTSELEPVKLVWYSSVAKIYPDERMVWDKILEYVKEKLNITLDAHIYQTSEYQEKISTIISSGQYADILFSGRAYGFQTDVYRDAFLPLENLIEEYMPKTYKNIPPGAWDAVTVNGHLYGIVPYKDLADRYSFVYNKTMTDKYSLKVPQTNEWTTIPDIVPLMYEAKAARDADDPSLVNQPIIYLSDHIQTNRYYPHEILVLPAVTNIPGVEAFKGKGKGETVFNLFETDEYKEACMLIKKLVDDGIFPYDPANFDKDHVLEKEGKIIGYFCGGLMEVNEDMFAGRKTAITLPDLVVMSTAYVQAGFQTLSSKTKYPERSLTFLELVNTDKTLANLLRFGIEGEHYNYNDEGRLDIYLGPRNKISGHEDDYAYFHWYGFQYGNILAGDLPTDVSLEFPRLLKETNDNSIQDTNLGFIVDTSQIQNEIAACSNVIKEFDSDSNLKSGMIQDLDSAIEEFRSKLRANGSEKIIEEVQRQLTAWRASVGKSTK